MSRVEETPDEDDFEAGREGSRLEQDDAMFCKECGIRLPWEVVVVEELEKCGPCKKEEVLDEIRAKYPGGLESATGHRKLREWTVAVTNIETEEWRHVEVTAPTQARARSMATDEATGVGGEFGLNAPVETEVIGGPSDVEDEEVAD